jgi:predicted RNA-binding Zn-ribbon protein involved in translation (DUF1610 family)
MERRKLTKADIDKVRDIEGFPIAKEEDIIALSDAPFYTACPNPFIVDFIKENGTPYDETTDDYHREPFAADVSEGKNDPIYMAHAYHTKVPHKAIMNYILHYTNPGDIVLDGFCGTGMTAVAAQMCDQERAYRNGFQPNKLVKKPVWGERKAIINDLAPAATFISANYNSSIEPYLGVNIEHAIEETRKEFGWLYRTKHTDGPTSFFETSLDGEINYVIWSDVFICPNCGKEVVFWDAAVDRKAGKINDVFHCSSCGMEMKKASAEKAKSSFYDPYIKEVVSFTKQIPVLIVYTYGGRRYEKVPDEDDLITIEKANALKSEHFVPVAKLPEGYNTEQPKRANGIFYVHQLFTPRNLLLLSAVFSKLKSNKERFVFTSILQNATKMYKYRTDGKGGIVTGTLYIPALNQENNIFNMLMGKLSSISKAAFDSNNNAFIVSTNSTTQLVVPDDCIDYIFTDPPFGANINYSELSFLWESWLSVFTNNKEEAISNETQNKGLLEYQELMTRCFSEYYRVLKPNRWMTVEFHNSKNAVWNAIQEALLRAGFIIADVRTLDKKQGSFKQVTSSSAVKQDLVISAYKPKDSFTKRFLETAGTTETVWSFVNQHLENLPIAVTRNGKIEIIAERQAYLLFDRMVAYHIMQGIAVPIDSTDFYRGLDEKYLRRDGMYFLPNQVNEYDTARIVSDVEPIQFSLIVSNEKTAISWLYQQLDTPQTYAEIQPKFMQEVKTIDKFEAMPELAVLLEENFLQDDKGRWYVPDVTKEADVAKLREKNLLKEFEGYLATKGKLKLFRTEAIRVGFAKLWKDKNYRLIVETADRLPEQIIQEDDKLLMYYDISLGRV